MLTQITMSFKNLLQSIKILREHEKALVQGFFLQCRKVVGSRLIYLTSPGNGMLMWWRDYVSFIKKMNFLFAESVS